MATQKPLPAIPTVPNLTTLVVEARNHRARFIRHFLSDIQDSWLEPNRETWACTLEDSLDRLSSSLSRGGWLAGVRRARLARTRIAKKDSDSAEQEKEVDAKLEKTHPESVKSKKSAQTSSSRDSSEEESLVSFPREESTRIARRALALQQIRELISLPPNPKPTEKHLLLCVAPLGSHITIPAEDSGFDIIPANIGCQFTPGVFSLPQPDSDEQDTVLYGLQEWQR